MAADGKAPLLISGVAACLIIISLLQDSFNGKLLAYPIAKSFA